MQLRGRVQPSQAPTSKNDVQRRKRREFPGQELRCPNQGCDRIFKIRTSLIRHVRWECQIDPPFLCAYCDRTSAYAVNIDRHCRAVHKDREPKGMYRENGALIEIEPKTFYQPMGIGFPKKFHPDKAVKIAIKKKRGGA